MSVGCACYWPLACLTHCFSTAVLLCCFHLQVCVQHFGDYTRARVSPASLLPTAVVLEQRLWLGLLARKPSRLVSTYQLSLKELITYCKVCMRLVLGFWSGCVLFEALSALPANYCCTHHSHVPSSM